MEKGWGGPRPPGSRLGRWDSWLGMLRGQYMLNYSSTSTPGGNWGPPLVHYPAQDVPACTEWGQKEAERLICWGHWGSMWRPNLEVDQSAMEPRRVPDLSQGDLEHLPQCLSVEKVPRSPKLWISAEKRSDLWHPLLPKKPLALVGVSHHSLRDMRACRQT